jgi:hypothetical protein
LDDVFLIGVQKVKENWERVLLWHIKKSLWRLITNINDYRAIVNKPYKKDVKSVYEKFGAEILFINKKLLDKFLEDEKKWRQ